MPRIYDSHGDPMDFCRDCFPTEEEAEENIRNKDWEESAEGRRHADDGNGGWGYDEKHPDYEAEWYVLDGRSRSDYCCHTCHKILRERDNLSKETLHAEAGRRAMLKARARDDRRTG